MIALYAQGRQHEALDAFQRCRILLDDELGLEPTPETKAGRPRFSAKST